MSKMLDLDTIESSLNTKGRQYLQLLKERIPLIENYELIGLLEPWKGAQTRAVLACKTHGRGDLFASPWIPIVNSVFQGYGCPKCSGKYQYTEQEVIELINDTGYQFCKFIDIFKGVQSKVIVECETHGKGDSFGNIWSTTLVNLKIGKGCPKCSGVYKRSLSEWQLTVTNQGYKYLGLHGDFKGKDSRVLIECPVHGRGEDYSNPWIPRFEDVDRGNGCPKCGTVYRFSQAEYIEKINATGYKFVEFIGGWKVIHTKVNVACSIHGEGKNFGTPWLPTINNLTRGGHCPKCVKRYVYTENEIIEKINNETRYTFIEYIGKFNGVKGSVIVSCPEHGRGDSFSPDWTPSVDALFSGRGCPKCGDIASVLENKSPDTPCVLYYIHFKYDECSFYKIGITTRGIEERFRRLEFLNISIVESNFRDTILKVAVNAEIQILDEYHLYKTDMRHVLKEIGGGTECFALDVLAKYDVTLDDYISLYS